MNNQNSNSISVLNALDALLLEHSSQTLPPIEQIPAINPFDDAQHNLDGHHIEASKNVLSFQARSSERTSKKSKTQYRLKFVMIDSQY